MKRKNLVLAFLALVLVLCASIGPAMAYFTTYTEAHGGYHIRLGKETRLREEISRGEKRVAIISDEDSGPLYVRIKAIAGSEYTLTYDGGSAWTFQGTDGYWYYNAILYGGETTDPALTIRLDNILRDEKWTDGDSVNIIVVYECTPVLYDAEGNPYADWDLQLVKGGESQ